MVDLSSDARAEVTLDVQSVVVQRGEIDVHRLTAFGPAGRAVGCVDWGAPSVHLRDAIGALDAPSRLREIGTPVVFRTVAGVDVAAELLCAALSEIEDGGNQAAASCAMEDGEQFLRCYTRGFDLVGRFVLSHRGGFYAMVRGEARS